MQIMPFTEFRQFAKPGCRVPLVGEIPLDLDTPLAVYKTFQNEPYRFLLESVERGEKWGRYSFIGLYPSLVFKASADRLDELRKAMNEYRFVPVPGLPLFPGGAVGIVSYDAIRSFEKIPDRGRKGESLPDLFFILPRILLVSDSFGQSLKIVYDARISKASSVKAEYERGCRMIKGVAAKIKARRPDRPKRSKALKAPKWTASMTPAEH